MWKKKKLLVTSNFFFFLQCVILTQIIVSLFVHIFYFISLFAAEFEEPKIGISGTGLTLSIPDKCISFSLSKNIHVLPLQVEETIQPYSIMKEWTV